MKQSRKLPVATTAAVVAVLTGFTPIWEGMDVVAKKDMIGTGHPVTYCYGQTNEFGKVAVGTRFTKQQCDELLAQSLPKYIDGIAACVTQEELPVKVWAAVVDFAYNAGVRRACQSPMVAKINAGDLDGACEAFDKHIVRGDGRVRKGLILRRAGEKYGDKRKSERALCLEGVREAKTKHTLFAVLWQKAFA